MAQANFRLLVSSLMRVAQANANPQNYLQTLASGQITALQARDGAQFASVSVNGKSSTLMVPAGSYTVADLTGATEYCLQLLEAGATRPTQRVKINLR